MPFEHARTYLERVLPWPPQGDATAYVNIHWTTPNKKPGGKPYFNGQACQTVDECIDVLTYRTGRPETMDLYVCMSTQRDCDTKVINGRPIRQAIRGQDSAVQLQSLFIDLDVKDKGYETAAHAAAAYKNFQRVSGMPPATLSVASGSGGVHLYWVLDRPLSVAEWQPLANALAEATRQAGLLCDTACTIDAARVLRVPETFNHKGGKLTAVRLHERTMLDGPYRVEDIAGVLEPYKTRAPAPAQPLPPRPSAEVIKLTDVNDELAAGVEARKAGPVDLALVQTECGFIRRAITEGGGHYDNALWNLSVLAATFAVDGRAMAHTMSSGHPEYSYEETDALYDRKLQERETRNVGWPTCRGIQNAGCGDCGSCVHLAQNLTPLHHGRVLPVAPEPEPGTMPHGYVQDARTQLVYKLIPMEDGTFKRAEVVPFPLSSVWVQDDPWMIHFQARHRGRKEPVHLSMPTGDLQSREFGGRIGRQGLVLNKAQTINLQDLLVAWTQHLQNIKGAVVSASPFGWSTGPNGGIDGFCYGSRVWGKGADRPASTPDLLLAELYSPHGELATWKEVAKVITDQKRPALDAIIASAFGAPLMRLAGDRGVHIAAFSTETGIGKSTAMKIAQAVWGNPGRGMQYQDDTPYSVQNKMGQLRSLPMYWDEIQSDPTDSHRLVKMIFSMTGGKERQRLNADSTQKAMGEWHTLLISASNQSVLDAVARERKTTTAGIARVFEFEVAPKATVVPQPIVSGMIAELEHNYGQAGLVYAQYLGANHEVVKEEVRAFQLELSQKLGMAQDERYWLIAMAVLYMGAKYANQLGLTSIDLKGLLRFLGETLQRMRKEAQSSSADIRQEVPLQSILNEYLMLQRARHTLFTNIVWKSAGKPVGVSIKGDTNRLEAIFVQIGQDDKVIRITRGHFREWLSERNYGAGAVTKALEERYGAKVVKGRIGSGTTLAGLTDYLLEIDTRGTDLAELTEGEGA